MSVCKLVSLDTSTTATGVAVWENGILKDYRVIKRKKETDIRPHIAMSKEILSFLEKIKPDIIAIELTCVPHGTGTQRVLDRILGNIELWAYTHKCFYYEIRPSVWRSLVKDKGEAIPKGRNNKKEWSVDTVCKRYGIKPETIDDNIADAILIGEAYIRTFTK